MNLPVAVGAETHDVLLLVQRVLKLCLTSQGNEVVGFRIHSAVLCDEAFVFGADLAFVAGIPFCIFFYGPLVWGGDVSLLRIRAGFGNLAVKSGFQVLTDKFVQFLEPFYDRFLREFLAIVRVYDPSFFSVSPVRIRKSFGKLL